MTLQTKQLTSAFDKQSRHISDLLAELREKESALHSQEEELQRCKQELDASKAHKAADDDRGEPKTLEESHAGPQEFPTRSPHTNNQESVSDAPEAPPSDNQLSGSGHKGEGEEEASAEPFVLCQENQRLRPNRSNLLDSNASKTSSSLTPVDDGNQEDQDQVEQNPSSSPAPSIMDQQGKPPDVTVGVTSCEEESVTGEGRSNKERMEDGCHTQINQLQQQVLITSLITKK